MSITQSVQPNFDNLKYYNPVKRSKDDIFDIQTPSNEPSKDEITTAKLKKALSECKYVGIAAAILYFGVKRIFKHEEDIAYAVKRTVPDRLRQLR